jgi:hypothetical protein
MRTTNQTTYQTQQINSTKIAPAQHMQNRNVMPYDTLGVAGSEASPSPASAPGVLGTSSLLACAENSQRSKAAATHARRFVHTTQMELSDF